MKYLWYKIGLLVVLTALVIYQQFSNNHPKKNIAMIINKKKITVNEFNRCYSEVYNQDKTGFINTLITKELLIQEAQRLGIDKEEKFRRSLQNYYEQSLVKLLMDRQQNDNKIELTEEDIAKFRAFQDKQIQFTMMNYNKPEDIKNGKFTSKETRNVKSRDLTDEFKVALGLLKPGETSAPICADYGCIVLKLDKVDPLPVSTAAVVSNEKLKEQLVNHKRQMVIDLWLADLKSRAVIENRLEKKE